MAYFLGHPLYTEWPNKFSSRFRIINKPLLSPTKARTSD